MADNPLPYGCDQCDGYGTIVENNIARICECKQKYLIQQAIKHSGIPPRFWEKSLANFETPKRSQKKALTLAQKYVKKFSRENNRGLLITGDAGTGKTHLAVAILKELIVKGFSGMFYGTVNLFRDLRSSYNVESALNEENIIDECLRYDILVLDDLGAEKGNREWVLDRLYAIINGRYENNKTLIVTTNLSLEDLEERIKYRILSRIYELCETVIIESDDYRLNVHLGNTSTSQKGK